MHDVHTLMRFVSARVGDGADGLDVRVPPTAGPAMGMRHRLAEAGALPADIADGSHMELLGSVLGVWILAETGAVDPTT